MSELKTIYCPKCGRKTGTYDGKATMNHVMKCKNCDRLVIYYPADDVIKMERMPQRTTSSGKRFY